MVAGETRKADAIAAASKPRMVCRISGARMAGSIAGWAQANISARRSSGIAVSSIGLAQFLGQQAQMIGRVAAGAPATRGIDQPAPRDRHQPRLRIARNAGGGPIGERRGEGVGQRVLRRRDIAACAPRGRQPASHSCGAPRPRPPLRRDGWSRAALHDPDRPHLDRADAGAGTAGRPGERGVQIGHVDQVVAGKLLLGFGIRAVEHLGLAVNDADRGRRS